MNALEQRGDRPPRFELDPQLAHHGLDLAEHDGHGIGKRRLGDARGLVALRCARSNTDQLPGRRQLAHHENQAAEENVCLARCKVGRFLHRRGLDERLDLIDRLAVENAQMNRQPPSKVAEHVAQHEEAQQCADILQCAGRTHLHDKPPPHFLVGARCLNGFLHPLNRALVQGAHEEVGLDPVIGNQRAVDVLRQRFGFRGHQVAADPFPDRLKRHARQSTDPFVVGGIVNQERLDRSEKQACGVADARHRLSGGTDDTAQFLQHELVAGDLVAAQHGALKLGHEHRPRLRLEGA